MICASQGLVELALGADRLQDRGAPLLQLAQVAQPLLERAQLRVVEQPGDLLAVAGDERHGRAAVEQLDGRASPAARATPSSSAIRWCTDWVTIFDPPFRVGSAVHCAGPPGRTRHAAPAGCASVAIMEPPADPRARRLFGGSARALGDLAASPFRADRDRIVGLALLRPAERRHPGGQPGRLRACWCTTGSPTA